MELNLSKKQLDNLDDIDNDVEILDLSFNKLTEIPSKIKGLNKLEILYISHNEINEINEIKNLPNTLQVLNISYNKITEIKNLPESLKILNISNNQISEIKNLPITLKELYISDNKITEINNLPSTLEILNIRYNQISELPLRLLKLRYLKDFYYNNNPIEIIPNLIQRWLYKLNNRNSLSNIIKDKDIIEMNIIIKDLNNQIFNELSKREIFRNVLYIRGITK